MGRPIQDKFFTAQGGSDAGNLQVTTAVGPEAIIQQKGTSTYKVASGSFVKLVDKTAGLVAGEASLTHEGKTVRKISQYRVSYFDTEETSGVWRDKDGNIIGTFVPALTGEVVVDAAQAPAPEPVVKEEPIQEDDTEEKDDY